MGKLLAELAPYAKAIRGAMTAILGALLVALVNGDGVSAVEWVVIALAGLGVGESVYSTWNVSPGGIPLSGGSIPPPRMFAAPVPEDRAPRE